MQWGPRLDGQDRSAHDLLDGSRGQRCKRFGLWLSIRQVEGVSKTAGRPVLRLGALDLTIALSPHRDSAACCASSLRWAPDIERRGQNSAGGVKRWNPNPIHRARAIDRSVLIVVVVVVMIGVIGVAAMVASVIGHGVSDCRAPDAAGS